MKSFLKTFSGKKTPEMKEVINQALHILDSLNIPIDKTPRQLEMMALCFLALGEVSGPKLWKNFKGINERTLKTREIISWINENFAENISQGSYDDIRRKHLKHLTMGRVALNSEPTSARNNPTRGYGIEPNLLEIIRKYPNKNWAKEISQINKDRLNISKALSGERELNKIPVKLPNNKVLTFSPGDHNLLQKKVIEEFLPRFGFGAEILYVGDTADKYLLLEKGKLENLNFFEISHGELPDIVAFSKSKNWLFLIEAVHSGGPMSPERVYELKSLTTKCTVDIVYLTAFLDKDTFRQWVNKIAWETEIWIANNPDHMIHFNGDKFLGPYK